MDDAAVANLTAMINLDAGVYDGVVADHTSLSDIGLRIDLDTLAELDAFADISESAYISVLRYLDSLSHIYRLFDARKLRGGHLLDHLKQMCNSGIGIIDTNERRLDRMLELKITTYDNSR